jgi:hypothetical protein
LLHQFDYNSPDYAGRLSEHKGLLGRLFQWLERISPIIAGIGPSVAVALGFAMLRWKYHLAEQPLDKKQSALLWVPSVAAVAWLVIVFPLRAKKRTKSHSRPLNDKLSKSTVSLMLIFLGFVILHLR